MWSHAPNFLSDPIQAALPEAELEMDASENPQGTWFLDATLDGHHAVIEWTPGGRIEITAKKKIEFLDPSDERFSDKDAPKATQRVIAILKERIHTS